MECKPVTKFYNIQAMRGIAAMLVVSWHTIYLEGQIKPGAMFVPRFFGFGGVGVDLFFVISGFVMATIIKDKFQQPGAVTNFLAHRITRIYPLYWFYTLLLVLFLSMYSIFSHKLITHASLIQSLLLWPQPPPSPVLGVGWTLIYEMYFYFIIAFLLFLPERKFLSALGVWMVFLIVSSHFYFASPAMQVVANPLACEFIAGCLLARFLFCTNKSSDSIVLILAMLVFLLGFGIYIYFYAKIEIGGWFRVLLFGIPSIAVIYSAVALELNGAKFPKVLNKIGDASYSIYLSHVLVLLVMKRILDFSFVQQPVPHFLVMIATFITVIYVGMFSYNYLEKPMMVYFRKLLTAKRTALSVD